MMIQNLPPSLKQQELVQELDASAFTGLYDYVFAPRQYWTGLSVGYAFVNFVNHEDAQSFCNQWDNVPRFHGPALLKVSPANVQGKAANMRKWLSAKGLRVKQADFRPLCILGTAGKGSGEGCGPERLRAETAAEATTCRIAFDAPTLQSDPMAAELQDKLCVLEAQGCSSGFAPVRVMFDGLQSKRGLSCRLPVQCLAPINCRAAESYGAAQGG